MFSETMTCVAGSRFIYAFARDRGFPFRVNDWVMQVDPHSGSPLVAIALYTGLQVLFMTSWTNENPQVAYSAVTGVTTNAFLTCYGLPSLLRVTTALKTFRPAPGFNLKWASVPLAILSAAYGAFSVGTIAMPNVFNAEGKVDGLILNYAVRCSVPSPPRMVPLSLPKAGCACVFW